jgi:hypothetical protein
VAIAGAVVGLRAMLASDRVTVADVSPVVTTINGVSITTPVGWLVADPDELGLNGPTDAPSNLRVGLPRLILAVSPVDPGELFGCPGMVEGEAPASLMTIQEGPLAIAGTSTAPWPASLESMPIESAGNDVVESGEAGCYPGWEFLRAGWTAAGRTFEARVGFAPDVTSAERDAMVAAFESMTFRPTDESAAAAVIATGSAGGETWELVAQRQNELVLTLQAESIGGGGGGFDPASPQLSVIDHVLGEGESAERIVFGAVPSTAVMVEAIPEEWLGTLVVDLLDVPDGIDPDLDAFVFTAPIDVHVTVTAYDAGGEIVGTGEAGPAQQGDGSDPVETPLPAVVDVAPEHAGRYWAVYLWVGESPDDSQAEAARDAAEHLGFNPGGGDLACDDGAASALGVPQGWSSVAIYFSTRQDAETAYGWLLENARGSAPAPAGVAEVTTYCLD